MSQSHQSGIVSDDMRSRLARVLKCLIKMRSAADPGAMHTTAICTHLNISPPTLKKLLSGDIGKVEHLVALTNYLSVKNHEVFLIAESYTSVDDLTYRVTSLIQKSVPGAIKMRAGHVQRRLA